MTVVAAGGGVRRVLAGSVAAGLLSQAVLVVSGVLAARMLGVENRGNLALLLLFPSVLSQLGGVGLSLALTYYVARQRGVTARIVRMLARPVALLTAALVLVHSGVIAWATHGAPEDVRTAGWLTLPAIALLLAQEYGLAILQGEQRFRQFNTLRVVQATLYSIGVATVFWVGVRSLPAVTAVWMASLGVAAGTIVAATVLGMAAGDPSAPVPTRSEIVRFGLSGFLGSVSPIDTFRLDQFIVGILVSPAALGLYVVATAFTNLPRFVGESVGLVAYPRVAAHPDRGSGARTMWRFVNVTALASGVAAIGIGLAAGYLVPFLFGAEFSGAVPVARVMLVAAFLLAVRRTMREGVKGLGRPALATVSEVASWVSLVPALLVLVPVFGLIGAGFAIVVSAAVGLAALWIGTARGTGAERIGRVSLAAPPGRR